MKYEFEGQHVVISKDQKRPKPKKITGTRFAGVLGFDTWNSPFAIWCEVTKAHVMPFEGNEATEAGQVIEPKIIEYLRTIFGRENVVDPTQIYGPEPYKKTYGNFFDHDIYGGMWDALLVDPETHEVEGVFEIKTTKRWADWENGAPTHQALQGALYAHLLDCPVVYMVGALIDSEVHYANPESFEPSVANIVIDEFDIYDRFPYFDNYVADGERFYHEHVASGVSPSFDEKKDKKYLDGLRTTVVGGEDISDLADVLREADQLTTEIESMKNPEVDKKEKRLKTLKEYIKSRLIERLRDFDTKSTVYSESYAWEVSRSTKSSFDEDAFAVDYPELYEKYQYEKISERLLTKKKEKE